jgi:hypothetical protein
MGSPTRYVCYGKEMLGWIHEKMGIQELAPGGGKFFASGSTADGNDTLACNKPFAPCGDCSTALGTMLGTMHIHLTHLTKVKG